MKKILLSIAMLALGVLLFNSCNKKQVLEEIAEERSLTAIKESGWNISGIKFGSSGIGIEHNVGLDKVAQLENFTNLTPSDWDNFLKKEYPQKFAELQAFVSDRGGCIAGYVSKRVIEWETGKMKARLSGPNCISRSRSSFEFTERQILETMLNLENAEKASAGYIEPMVKSFNDLFFDIQSNDVLTLEERDILSASLEVAFFSKLYWMEASINPENPWHETINGATFNDEDFFDEEFLSFLNSNPSTSSWWERWRRPIIVGSADVLAVALFWGSWGSAALASIVMSSTAAGILGELGY